MTAKEQLLERVTKLSAAEADETLRLLTTREDPMLRLLDDAPLEDEEISAEEEEAVQEARDELAAGVPTIPHDEIKREFGIEWPRYESSSDRRVLARRTRSNSSRR